MNQYKVDKVARVKCQKRLEFFTRYFFKKLTKKKFIVDPHHIVIFEALERVIRGECPRLIITIAPRYNKTTIAVHMFISHCLCLYARAKFIHLSYSDSLALDNSETIKDIILSHEYQELFPEVQIKYDSKAKNKWYTTEDGGVLARSAAGQVTGFGAGEVAEQIDDILTDEDLDWLDEKEGFGGAIIIDDPIKPEDADSQVKREKVNQRFDSTIRNRVNDRSTPIIVIMQRTHPDDLVGYLTRIEPDVWEVISLPAIQEDEDGEKFALCPRIHTLDELYELRRVNEIVFDRQYMQDPRPKEGLLFHESVLKFYDGKEFDPFSEEIDATTGFIDTADTGADDLCQPMGFNIGPKIFIHDVVFTKEGVEINTHLCAEPINKYKPEYVRVESNMGGSMYINLLRPLITGETQLLPISAKANKHTRIWTMSGFIKEFCYFRDDDERGEMYDQFMTGLTTYLKDGSSQHDDAPDGLTGLVAMIKRFLSHLYEDIYHQEPDGYGEE